MDGAGYMGYRLRDGLSFGIVAGNAVFLDTIADRYFCLASEENGAFLDFVSRGTLADAPAIDRTITSLLKPDDKDSVIAAASVPLATMTLDSTVASVRITALSPPQLWTRFYVSRALRRGRLESLLDRTKTRFLYERLQPQDERFKSLVHDLRAVERVFTTKDRCLHNSLALRRNLEHHGYSAALVFGVKLLPFEAHCWLQIGPVVINDHHEQTAEFTPVLCA